MGFWEIRKPNALFGLRGGGGRRHCPPPIHCGFHPLSLSKAIGEGKRDEKKNPLESQRKASLSPTPLGENFKKRKTNHNAVFIPAQSRRHNALVLPASGIPFSHCSALTDTSRMTSLCSAKQQLLLPETSAPCRSSTGKQRIRSALIFGRQTIKQASLNSAGALISSQNKVGFKSPGGQQLRSFCGSS